MFKKTAGLAAYGLDIHETLLPTIDFCIFVTTMKTNSDEKMKSVLNKIAGYDCPTIIVQNMLDSVKESPDGRKSIGDVANDHKARVERIVNQSEITNKNSVRVVQMSSRLALKGRVENDAALLEKWGYNAFVDAVSKTLDDIRPYIEARALRSIKERIGELITQAKQDMNADKEELLSLKFEFEGLDAQIKDEYDNTGRKLSDILLIMNETLETIKESKGVNTFVNNIFKAFAQITGNEKSSAFGSSTAESKKLPSIRGISSEEDVDKLIQFKNQCESDLLEAISRYNKKISGYCKKLGESERRLKRIEGFGTVPELRSRQTTRTRRVEKTDGPFGGNVARFFGKILNTDWGYEEVSERVFDSRATLDAAVKYLETVVQNCTADCAKWLESAQSYAEQLCGVIKRESDENEARKAGIPDRNAMLGMIRGLESLYAQVPYIKPNSSGTVKRTATELTLPLEKMSVEPQVYGIYKLAGIIKRKISFYVMQKTHTELCCAGADLIVSWDALCASAFLSNSFGKTISDSELKGINIIGNIATVVLPTTNAIAETNGIIKKLQGRGGTNLFVMFNAIQYGEARSALDRLGVTTMLNSGDRLFLVAQDFEELINGDCVCDALRNMREACSELETKAPCSILINSENPIYGLTALYAALSNPTLLIDEVNCLSELRRHFPYLLSIASEREVCEIIRAYRN